MQRYKSTYTGPQMDVACERALPGGEIDQMRPTRNLLDNWYFGSPVNQRGQTEWLSSASASVPCVDRWIWWGQYVAGSTLKLLDDGLQLVGKPEGGLYQSIGQSIEKDRLPVGATVTLSALVKADVNASIILSIGGPNYGAVTAPANTWTLIAAVLNAPSVEQTHSISVQRNTDGATFTVKAVKLELGSQQTLAHQDESGNWILNEIPDYGEQMLRCQRYFQIYSSADKRPAKAVDCRPAMRVDPAQGTVVIDGVTYYYNTAEL